MIVDAHCHVGEIDRHFPRAFAETMMGSVGLPAEMITTCMVNLLRTMDAHGIDKAFLLAFDAERTMGVKVPNDYVAALCRGHPDRFFGFCSVDAGTPGMVEEVERCVRVLGMHGIKIAPAYVRLAPDDRAWYPLYETAAALHKPVLMHTGWTTAKGAALSFGRPSLKRVAEDFPNLRIIMAHMSMPWVDQCLDLVASYPHLYADLSLFGWYQPVHLVAEKLTRARELGAIERIIWGTDHPWGPIGAFLERMSHLKENALLFPNGKALDAGHWHQIMGATALQLVA